MSEEPDWEGRTPRSCGEHRTTGGRAWCFECHEWCHGDDAACVGCRCPQGVETALDERDAAVAAIDRVRALHWPSPDRDPACDCYDGLTDCPTIAALNAEGDAPVPWVRRLHGYDQ